MGMTACKAILALILLPGLLWLAACAEGISPETVSRADEKVSFRRLLKDPNAFYGKTVLLGGSIIKTENMAQKTLIIVLQHPLDSDKKPVGKDESEGRFIVSAPGFLDPAIYRQGREITVAGRVAGQEVRTLDRIRYAYPVIEKTELHLWPEEKALGTEPAVTFGIGLGFGF